MHLLIAVWAMRYYALIKSNFIPLVRILHFTSLPRKNTGISVISPLVTSCMLGQIWPNENPLYAFRCFN